MSSPRSRGHAALVVEPEAAGVLVVVESLLPAVASDFVVSGLLSAGLSADGFSDDLLPPRKSVAYQPLPFNWKPAAETSFCSASLPHAGQVTRGASDRRWSVSSLCSHCVHRYS